MKDKELLRITTQFTKGILGKRESKGMCFAVCSPLQSYLSMCGVQVDLCEGWVRTDAIDYEHYWLRISDGRILDPTADQFNSLKIPAMPQVYLGEKPEHYSEIIPVVINKK